MLLYQAGVVEDCDDGHWARSSSCGGGESGEVEDGGGEQGSDGSHQGFEDCPRLECLDDVHPEETSDEPEGGVVDVWEDR